MVVVAAAPLDGRRESDITFKGGGGNDFWAIFLKEFLGYFDLI